MMLPQVQPGQHAGNCANGPFLVNAPHGLFCVIGVEGSARARGLRNVQAALSDPHAIQETESRCSLFCMYSRRIPLRIV